MEILSRPLRLLKSLSGGIPYREFPVGDRILGDFKSLKGGWLVVD